MRGMVSDLLLEALEAALGPIKEYIAENGPMLRSLKEEITAQAKTVEKMSAKVEALQGRSVKGIVSKSISMIPIGHGMEKLAAAWTLLKFWQLSPDMSKSVDPANAGEPLSCCQPKASLSRHFNPVKENASICCGACLLQAAFNAPCA
ncbi:hypothetical protein AAFF_G00040620 [Aldrovandia affinis]|uniref:Uncharacterized protein n=1 Tax=Aldrovandia affinis TaxID=143900 RepID=A0AAD7S2W6_9TELE|nr:hypothetical protein AAFF_G00040620 [Aldrovandia affinis]